MAKAKQCTETQAWAEIKKDWIEYQNNIQHEDDSIPYEEYIWENIGSVYLGYKLTRNKFTEEFQLVKIVK